MQGNNEKYYNLETESKSGTHTVHLEYKWTALNYWLKEIYAEKAAKKKCKSLGLTPDPLNQKSVRVWPSTLRFNKFLLPSPPQP